MICVLPNILDSLLLFIKLQCDFPLRNCLSGFSLKGGFCLEIRFGCCLESHFLFSGSVLKTPIKFISKHFIALAYFLYSLLLKLLQAIIHLPRVFLGNICLEINGRIIRIHNIIGDLLSIFCTLSLSSVLCIIRTPF